MYNTKKQSILQPWFYSERFV